MADEPVNQTDEAKAELEASHPDKIDESLGLDPQTEKDFEDKFEALKLKARAAKASHKALLPPDEKEVKKLNDQAGSLKFGMAIAYTIVGVPTCMALIGWWIDSATDSNVFRSLLALIGAVLGLTVAIVLIYRNNDAN